MKISRGIMGMTMFEKISNIGAEVKYAMNHWDKYQETGNIQNLYNSYDELNKAMEMVDTYVVHSETGDVKRNELIAKELIDVMLVEFELYKAGRIPREQVLSYWEEYDNAI